MRTAADSEKRNRAWIHVALIFSFMLINYADKAILGLSSAPIMHELGLSNTQFGELGSAFFMLFSVSGLVVGFLANHVRTKTLLGALAVGWGLVLLPVAWVSSFGLLLTSRILLGAAEGPSFPVAIHAVHTWFDDSRRALPTSIVACGAAVGTGVVAPFLTLIIVSQGWRTAFVVLGLVGFGWAYLWSVVATDGPVDGMAGTSHSLPTRVPYRQLLSSRTAIGVFLAGFAAYWLIALNVTWLANYLVKSLLLAPAQAAWIVALPSAMQMVLAPGLAWISQYLRQRGVSSRVSRGVLGSLCVAVAGLAMVCMASMAFGILKVLVIGLCFSVSSVIFTLGATLIGEISPPAQRGAMLGVTNALHTLAGLCAPIVMGSLVDLGTDPQAGFREGFIDAGAWVAVLGLSAAVLIDPEADLRKFRRHPVSEA